jgi:hypothetical protein
MVPAPVGPVAPVAPAAAGKQSIDDFPFVVTSSPPAVGQRASPAGMEETVVVLEQPAAQSAHRPADNKTDDALMVLPVRA